MQRLAFSLFVGAVALLAGCHRLPGPRGDALFTLADPAGDDHGDGDLRLPASGEPGPGELDLVALRVFRSGEDLEIEAEFARAIRRPDVRAVALTGATQESVAKLGFWTFNLDLHVDLDRVPGSGRTDTLPGRLAAVAPETAWERVICLTPRPADARRRLVSIWTDDARRRKAEAKESLTGAEDIALERAVADEVEARVLFPARVAVSGPRVRFTVPATFLPPAAAPRAAWVAVVTAATLDERFEFGSIIGRPSTQGLFLLDIQPGVQKERLGGGRINDPLQPPIVDILLDGAQEATLRERPPVLRGVLPKAAP
jgi:hypothetical protein